MRLNEFGIICSDTSRSRAYMQLLLEANFIPKSILILVPNDSENTSLGKFKKSYENEIYEGYDGFNFDPKRH